MGFTRWLTVSFPPPLPVAFPSALVAAADAVTVLSPGLQYYSTVRRLTPHRVPFRLSTYRVAYPDASRERRESSWGHAQIFRTVPSAHTLVRRVDVNAFASIVQARPCPVFGRPVHQWACALRLRPGTAPHALRIPPHGGHPALRLPVGRVRT